MLICKVLFGSYFEEVFPRRNVLNELLRFRKVSTLINRDPRSKLYFCLVTDGRIWKCSELKGCSFFKDDEDVDDYKLEVDMQLFVISVSLD